MSAPRCASHVNMTTRLLLKAWAVAESHMEPLHIYRYPKKAPRSSLGMKPKGWKCMMLNTKAANHTAPWRLTPGPRSIFCYGGRVEHTFGICACCRFPFAECGLERGWETDGFVECDYLVEERNGACHREEGNQKRSDRIAVRNAKIFFRRDVKSLECNPGRKYECHHRLHSRLKQERGAIVCRYRRRYERGEA